jgi:hypothetical protein
VQLPAFKALFRLIFEPCVTACAQTMGERRCLHPPCKDNKDFDRSAFFNVHFSLHHPISAARYPSSATQPTGRKRQETPNILFNKSLRVLAIFAISLPVGRKYANLKPLFKWLTISVLYF